MIGTSPQACQEIQMLLHFAIIWSHFNLLPHVEVLTSSTVVLLIFANPSSPLKSIGITLNPLRWKNSGFWLYGLKVLFLNMPLIFGFTILISVRARLIGWAMNTRALSLSTYCFCDSLLCCIHSCSSFVAICLLFHNVEADCSLIHDLYTLEGKE